MQSAYRRSVMRAEPNAYIAVDVSADGGATLDRFSAPNDAEARRRALAAAEGVVVSLWCDGRLLGHWRRDPRRGFRPASGDAPPVRPKSS
jgi:hypothetical protein